MEKQKLVLKPIKNVLINYNGLDIEIIPYISPENEIFFTSEYIKTYFRENDSSIMLGNFNFIGAEFGLMLGIIDKLTNIEVIDIDGNVIDLNDVVCRDLFSLIKNEIKNYQEFEKRLYRTVNDIKEQRYNEKSAGFILENLYNKILEFLDKISSLDLSESGLDNLSKNIGDLQQTLSKSPIKSLMDESQKVEQKPKRSKKPRKSS